MSLNILFFITFNKTDEQQNNYINRCCQWTQFCGSVTQRVSLKRPFTNQKYLKTPHRTNKTICPPQRRRGRPDQTSGKSVIIWGNVTNKGPGRNWGRNELFWIRIRGRGKRQRALTWGSICGGGHFDCEGQSNTQSISWKCGRGSHGGGARVILYVWSHRYPYATTSVTLAVGRVLYFTFAIRTRHANVKREVYVREGWGCSTVVTVGR